MIHTDRIDRIITGGTGRLPRKIRLTDEAVISVHAGPGAYCTPRPQYYGRGDAPADFAGPYTALEVFLVAPLALPEGWERYYEGEPDDTGVLCANVPVDEVRALVVEHGGEHVAQDEMDDVWRALGESVMPD